MKNLPRIGFGIIMVTFVYLVIQLTKHDVPLNVATWGMWVIIDSSLLFAMILSGNKRPWSMIGFTTGAIVITTIAIGKLIMGHGTWHWGNTESLAAICVLIAMAIWKFTSGNGGIVSITAAMYIAMIPTFADMWNNPHGQDPWFWGASSLGCLLELIGKPKTIAQAFFPICGTLANGLACLLCLRQFLGS